MTWRINRSNSINQVAGLPSLWLASSRIQFSVHTGLLCGHVRIHGESWRASGLTADRTIKARYRPLHCLGIYLPREGHMAMHIQRPELLGARGGAAAAS